MTELIGVGFQELRVTGALPRVVANVRISLRGVIFLTRSSYTKEKSHRDGATEENFG